MEEQKKNRAEEQDILERKGLKEMPFSLPDFYFENLEVRIRERISAEKTSEGGSHFFLVAKSYVGLAAAFLLVVVLGFGVRELTKSITSKQMAVAEESYNTYLLDSLERVYYTNVLKYEQSGQDTLVFYNLDEDFFNAELSDEEREDIIEYIEDAPSFYSSLIAAELGALK